MTRSETMKALRESMNGTIEEVSRVAREAKLRLENLDAGRRLHSSTFRLNVSAFDGIGGAF